MQRPQRCTTSLNQIDKTQLALKKLILESEFRNKQCRGGRSQTLPPYCPAYMFAYE